MTISQVLVLVGLFMFAIGVLQMPREKGLWSIFMTVCVVAVIFFALAAGADRTESKLAGEATLNQVAVKGQTVFIARVRITYKDGKLEAVTLVPGTTALAPTPMPPTNLRIK